MTIAINARVRSTSVLLAAMLAAGSALASSGPTAPDWRKPWVQAADPAAAAAQSDEYAWHLFVAINWPADTRARAPNRSTRFGADGPVVWETWADAEDIYLARGADPGPWRRGRPAPVVADRSRFETFSLKDLPNARHIVDGRMVPLTDPIASAKRLTEIRMNRAAFEYLRARELYNVEGQLRAAAADGVHFPSGAAEVKAKWRPIRADERARYHTLEVKMADGSLRLYGLTALHVVSKDLPNWFWATFEHVDNASLPDGEGWQLPTRDRFACGASAADCNRAPNGIGLEGTVWQNYRLRGTMTNFVEGEDRPVLLANSELEAGMQNSSSCMTCHARSAIALVGGMPLRLPVFDTSGSAAGGAADHAADGGLAPRRGSYGLPSARWFDGPASAETAADASGRPLFHSLDFVWSLSKAQSKKRGS